jgi:hypothetical protein
MRAALWLMGVVAALYALHRLALWAEAQGWIYYRKSGGFTTRTGNAMLEIQQLLEPEKKHVIEMKQEQKAERDDSGDGADPNRPQTPVR